jgi:hypothetical protein
MTNALEIARENNAATVRSKGIGILADGKSGTVVYEGVVRVPAPGGASLDSQSFRKSVRCAPERRFDLPGERSAYGTPGDDRTRAERTELVNRRADHDAEVVSAHAASRRYVLATVAMQTASEEGCFSLPLPGTARSPRLVRGIFGEVPLTRC